MACRIHPTRRVNTGRDASRETNESADSERHDPALFDDRDMISWGAKLQGQGVLQPTKKQLVCETSSRTRPTNETEERQGVIQPTADGIANNRSSGSRSQRGVLVSTGQSTDYRGWKPVSCRRSRDRRPRAIRRKQCMPADPLLEHWFCHVPRTRRHWGIRNNELFDRVSA